MIKKEWKRPQLVILTQSKAGEDTLAWCKSSGAVSGPGYLAPKYTACSVPSPVTCQNCMSIAYSQGVLAILLMYQ